MSGRCQVTGRQPGFGKSVSHSHVRTSRQWLPSQNRWVTLRVSTKGIKTIDKRGIEAVVAELRARGEKV
jgi:large subunit ribosomal protein L28